MWDSQRIWEFKNRIGTVLGRLVRSEVRGERKVMRGEQRSGKKREGGHVFRGAELAQELKGN